MRILIAEDDTALAGFVRKGLEAEHYAVDVSNDGEQARALRTVGSGRRTNSQPWGDPQEPITRCARVPADKADCGETHPPDR
jgi:CheY-like chemotaxis protein